MACSKITTKLESILKCAVCQDRVKKPQTLTCFHSFCEDCTNEITVRGEEEVNRIQCPVCRSVTRKENVSSNFLVKELLDMHSNEKTCETCAKGEPKWRCLACKVDLCEDCKQVHSKLPLLRSHKVVDHNSAAQMVIDRLVFCSIHNDEPVKYNCTECETPLCTECKMMEHVNHNTETIEKCLERSLPEINQHKTKICEVVKEIDEKVKMLVSNKEKLQAEFVKCRDQAKINLNAVIEKVREQHSQLIKQLDIKEEEELTKLELTQDELEGKRNEFKHVVEWVDTSLEIAKGVTLMAEIQSGLLNKVKRLAEFKVKHSLTVEFPSLESAAVLEDYIGKPTFKTKLIIKSNNKPQIAIPETFSGLKCVQTIPLSKRCTRMGLINRNIWCPLQGTNVIEVVTSAGLKGSEINMPRHFALRAVEQAMNGDIFLASDTGIHIINEDGLVRSKLVKGMFSDISNDGDIMVALNYGSSEVHVFKNENNKWNQVSQKKTSGNHTHNQHTILLNYSEQCIYISDLSNITVYDINGSQRKTYRNFNWPFLCETNNTGQVLLADCVHHQLKTIKDGITTDLFKIYYPFSCICVDANDIWILLHNNGPCQIEHYTT